MTIKKEEDKIVVKKSNSKSIDIVSGGKTTTIGSAIRYQFNYYFLETKIINPFVAASPSLFLYYNKMEPANSLSFPSKYTDIYIPLDIILGADFNLSEQLSLNVDLPFTFYQFGYKREFIDNPQLAEDLRKTSTINGESFPKLYNFRIGISYRL